MILADTSIWIDHFRNGNAELANQLERHNICIHSAIIGEIALGSLKDRELVIGLLESLPHSPDVSHDEVMKGIEIQSLYSRGIGYVDAQLALSCLLDRNIIFWTTDRRLAQVCEDIGVRTFSG